jgi:hypothetical protein
MIIREHCAKASNVRLVLGSWVALGLAFIGAESQAQTPSSNSTFAPAVFTAAQASRGRTVYEQSCAACHGAELTGGVAPPLMGPPFRASFSHPLITLDDIFFLVRTTMPPRASASVSGEDHAAVFACLMQMNGYEAGLASVQAGAPGLLRPPLWMNANRDAGDVPSVPVFVVGDPGAVPARTGPDQSALTAADDSTDWLHYTHDCAGTRFSPLDQINAANASSLVPACVFQIC